MASSSPQEPENRLLRGWKDIAAYLGTSQRSAQRFAADLNLPVHRTGRVHGAVSAFASELDAWTRRRTTEGVEPPGEAAADPDVPSTDPPAPASTPLVPARLAAAALATVAVAGIVVWLLFSTRGPNAHEATAQAAPSRASAVVPHDTAAQAFVLWLKLRTGREVELRITDGPRATLQTEPDQQLQFEAEPRGERLRVRLYEVVAGSPRGEAPQMVGVVDLVQSRREARLPVQLQFTTGSLELAWLDGPQR